MNIVFWLIVVLIFVCIWFSVSSYFGKIGGTAKDILEETKIDLKRNEDDINE